MNNQLNDIKKYLEGEKVKVWPAKKTAKLEVLKYLASKFDGGKFYTEKEVGDIINKYQTFGDAAFLRRELFDNYFLNREPDGSKYWKDRKSE